MVFGGFLKMTMVDFPGKVACTVFVHGCNFRCPFCHNARLVVRCKEESYAQDEILSYLEKRKGILDGVCISGGEPLLYDEIFDFAKKVKELGLLVKLDTNGSFPEKLEKMIDAGLVDYVAMDIKSSKERYAETVGLQSFCVENIEKSIALLLSGKVDYEFRTTVTENFINTQDIVKIGEWIRGAKRYFLQSFVDSGDLIGENISGASEEFMKEAQKTLLSFVNKVEIRGI